ncbi:MAG: signal peptide peptidase SppA [Phycisphaerales bacterium]|nr:signal peptide peptidase SppA [Phycisphaerales bacterium]
MVLRSRNRSVYGVMGGAALALLVLSTPGCGPTSFLITPVSARQPLQEEVVIRESFWSGSKIVLLDVDGVIQSGRPMSLLGTGGENPVSLFVEKLDKAAADDRVKAVVLRINSPGGAVTATDVMHAELQRFRERTGKPVVAALQDVAASGGYYLACASDRIYAHPTTVTGSIGVIMLSPNFAGTMRKIGMEMNTIKSGEQKDMGSLFREMSNEDRLIFQGLIDAMYQRFLTVVAAGRPNLTEEELRPLADGRVYLGAAAHELGLVDELGTLRDALRAARELAELGDAKLLVVRYARPLDYRPNIYAQQDPPPVQVGPVGIELPEWLRGGAPQFLYLWAPGF